MPIGKRISVSTIHEIVERNWKLTQDDWIPNPSERARRNNYPAWKKRVQGALSNLKRRGKIQHFRNSCEYIFNSYSFD
jgi:hypothetical protein